jgi:hypothetical protein
LLEPVCECVISCVMATAESKVVTRNTAKSNKPEATEQPTLVSIDEKLNSILNILGKHSDVISEIKKEQHDMSESIELCHKNISDFTKIVSNQGVKIAECEKELLRMNNEVIKLSSELKKSKQEVNELEQYSHRNNLIIYGIPEDKGENIQHVLRRLANALQFAEWSPSLVDAVHRMGKSNQSQPRPIIIKFVSRLVKEEFWIKRKVKRNLKATDLGFSSENSIYINESLTHANRELLRMTRVAARQKGYTQVWTSNCSIFVRREKGSQLIKITSTNDIDLLL